MSTNTGPGSPLPVMSARTLADLDGDALAHCAGYLGARDVASLAMACRTLRASAYSDAVWYRLFRDQWPHQQVPRGTLGLRNHYIHRHTEVHKMKFDDPASAIYYFDPAEVMPSHHLMLDHDCIWFCQGPVARKLSVGWPGPDMVETHRSHGARITCMRSVSVIDTPLFRSDTQTCEKALITSSTDRTIRLCWKGNSRCYKGHSGPVTALADKLLVDGEFKVLASGGEDCTIRLWSMSTRAKNRPLVATFHGHEKSLALLSVAWHKSSLLVSSSKDSKVRAWDTMAPLSGSASCVGSTHLSSTGPPIAMKCHQSLCYIAAGSEVTAIDLRTMKKASVLALHNHRILSCEMLPSEWLICTGTYNNKALLWDIRKSQEVSNTVAELYSDGPVKFLHLDPYKVVTGGPMDDQVHVWETRTGNLLNTLSCGGPAKSVGSTTVSAMAVDGCRIAMAGTSAVGSFVHYRDFMKSSVPVSLPGKEVSKFWRPQRSDDNSDDSSEDEFY